MTARTALEYSDLDGSETYLSYDEGILNAVAFEYFVATIRISASAFDPLAPNNEMAIRGFLLFESHRKIR
ncbi:hypothetical protein PC117_g20520 [Phytophthora cactorum]|uniref:Uncharacterized protein n=1 Tax=Phytophthora cactorum TaxID=29920 RepID=A0A8T1BM21_9STRA|nr:hypothetical protein PC117_g20520 [Phytophthora cactorum]